MSKAPIRVLLVEDSPSDAQLLKEYLGLAGSERFDVIHVERLEQALSRLKAEAFDVVLLDLSLPDSRGHNTFLRAQAEAPHIPIVVLSGTSDELLGIEAVRHGVQDYLVKGQTDERQIARAIRYAIERNRAEIALIRQRRTLDALMGAAADHFYMWDRQKRYIYINPAALKSLGRTSDEVLGKTWRDLGMPAEVMEPFEAEVDRVFAKVCSSSGELNFPLTSGPHHFEYIVNPVVAAGGQVEAVAINTRDITQRRHMEDALREGEERFRLASDASHALVYDVDQRVGRALSVHGLPALLGYDPNEAPQTVDWWFGQVHPDDSSAVRDQLREAFASAGGYSIQYRLLHKDGRCIIVQDEGQIIRDATGQPVRSVGSVVDITRRRQLEDALRESEERLRLAINAANEAIWDWDLVNGKMSWNETYANTLELPQTADDPHQWWVKHLHSKDRAQTISSLRAALDGTDESWTAEYRIRRRDGSWAYMFDRAVIARDASGKATRVIGAMLDLTERKRAEAALRESEERYRQLADKLERMVAERTADLQRLNRTLEMIGDCNEAIVRAHREEDLLADICRIVVDVGGYRMAWVGIAEDDPAKTVQPVACAGSDNGFLSRAQISWADNERGQGPTGSAVRSGKPSVVRDFKSDPGSYPAREEALRCGFRSSVALPLAGSDKPFGSLTIYSSETDAFDEEQVGILQELSDDLTFGITALRTRAERDHALRSLERRTSQLRVLASELAHIEERERRQLAQAIHDNLQQLLVGAKLCNDTLHKRCQTKQQQEVIAQLGEFLKESLDATRSLTFELSPPVLYDVGLAAALEWLGRWMEAKHGLTVAVNADRQLEPENEDVRNLLFRATRELLFNVVKHAQVKAAEVRMSSAGEGRVRIVVRDKGVGFDPARSGGEELQGGFGLFSIRERLDLLGGEMEIESSPGQGSRFTLVAPLGSAASTRPPAPAVRPAAGRHQRKTPRPRTLARAQRKIRVLLADDHSLMRQGLVRLLREQGDIDVVGEASDGQEALDLVRETKPDVVLMDVHMPRMNGIEATARLTEERPEVKVVAMSMWDESDWITAMTRAGARAYLNKTGPLATLIDAIRKCAPTQESGGSSDSSRIPRPRRRRRLYPV